MSRPLRSLILLAAAAMLAMVGGGVWVVFREPWKQARRLPDGSILTLEDVTYGSQHRIQHGTWWQEWLHPLVPPGLRDRSGLWTRQSGWMQGAVSTQNYNSLIVWATRRGMPRGRSGPLRAVALDANGDRCHTVNPHSASLMTPPPNALLFWDIPVFPRRGRTVRVQIEEEDSHDRWNPAAQFVVPNPAPGPHPNWTAQPLPITRQAGDLSVTLAGLQTVAGKTFATFRTTQDGRSAKDWRLQQMTVSDATGNTCWHRLRNPFVRNGEEEYAFGGVLPLDEPAWKVRVELQRVAGFGPDELWRVRSLPVPQPNRATGILATTTRQGTELSLELMGKGNQVQWERIWRGRASSVRVAASSPPKGLQLTLLRATDDQGRTIPTYGPVSVAGGGWENQFRLWNISPGAKTMDLTFAVHPNRFVEFLARPAPLRAARSSQDRAAR